MVSMADPTVDKIVEFYNCAHQILNRSPERHFLRGEVGKMHIVAMMFHELCDREWYRCPSSENEPWTKRMLMQ